MNKTITNPNKPSTIYNMSKKGVLQITPMLAAQITALHKFVGPKEWSGVLVYRTISEDIANPENFRAVAEGIFPMDIGTGAYTEYEHDEDTLEMFERYPKADPATVKTPLKLGQIHTHHNMSAYFSGTDNDELKENAGKYNYYLSLIVNFNGDYCAKIAFEAKTETQTKKRVEYKVKNKWSRFEQKNEEKSEMVLVTFDLEVKVQVDEWFNERMRSLNKYKPTTNAYNHSSSNNRTYPSGVVNRSGHPIQQQSQAPTYSPRPLSQVIMGEPLRTKIKDKLSFLLLKNKELAMSTKFYWAFDRAHELHKTPTEIQAYSEDVLSRFDGWIKEYFEDEVKGDIAGFMEEKITREVLAQCKAYQSGFPVAANFVKELEAYIKIMYDYADSRTSQIGENRTSDLTHPYEGID